MNPTHWHIPSLGADESIPSALERAAGFLECRSTDLWATLIEGDGAPGTPDTPSPGVLQRLAKNLGEAPTRVACHRLLDTRRTLIDVARHAYCPTCWQDDLAANRPCTFRRAWAHVTEIECPTHQLPLLYWRERLRGESDRCRPEEVDVMRCALTSIQRQPGLEQTLHTLGAFAAQLEACIHDGIAPPAGWARKPERLLQAAAAVITDADVRGGMWVTAIPLRWRGLVHLGRGPMRAAKDGPWQTLRQAVDPGLRRAAFWYAASLAMPASDWATGVGQGNR